MRSPWQVVDAVGDAGLQLGWSLSNAIVRVIDFQGDKGADWNRPVEFTTDAQALTLKDSKSPFPLWGFQLDGLAKLNEINLIREMDGAH